jgi:hypothetical protein
MAAGLAWSGSRHLRPDAERSLPEQPMMHGLEEMSPDLEQVMDRPVHH